MQARIKSPDIVLMSQSQDNDTFTCRFNIVGPLLRGHVWFNLCTKVYPVGASVICEQDGQDCKIVCSKSMEGFKVYPMAPGVISLVVRKRLLKQGKRRSVDEQVYLNSALMTFEEDDGKTVFQSSQRKSFDDVDVNSTALAEEMDGFTTKDVMQSYRFKADTFSTFEILVMSAWFVVFVVWPIL